MYPTFCLYLLYKEYFLIIYHCIICGLVAGITNRPMCFERVIRVGMFGRKYQWLIMGTYVEDWWRKAEDTFCSGSELATALEGCILTDYLPLASSKVITISGFVSIIAF